MPSGAKKRRIAKKKKGLQMPSSNPNSSVLSQDETMVGSDDVQHYDDKGSDSGYSGSPASQEHLNSENPFAESNEKEVEKREVGSSGQLAVSEQSSREVGVSSGENVMTEESIVQIEWELKSEEDYGSKEGSIESKEVNTGGSSGSSSSSSGSRSSSIRSSSDDESHVEKTTEMVETGQVNTSILAGENCNAASKSASVVTPDKASLIEDVVQIDESSFGDHPVIPVDDKLEVQEVGYKLEAQVSADKNLPSFDNGTGVAPILIDLGSRKVEDKVVLTSEEKPAIPVDVNNSAMEGKDAKLMLSINAPTVHASKDADHIKVSDSPECSESQSLIASAPQAVQKTSLKSCCGIFELFTSADR